MYVLMNTTSIVYVLQNCYDMRFIRLNIITEISTISQ